jgi:hyperosmotically inducible protein
MRISFLLLIAALAALAGCDSSQNRATTSSTPTTVARPSYDTAASPSGTGDGDTSAANSSATRGTGAKLAPASTDKPSAAGPVEPDNTAVNERDRNRETKTPIDQNENQRDVNITADIRKAVLAEKDMSINARNVKIITADGKVTLRGPVNSDQEKEVIDDIARRLAGKDNVTNEIEVKAQK